MACRPHHIEVVGPADPARYELQRFLLDRAHAPDERLLHHHLAVLHDRGRDVLAQTLIHVQHVQVDASELRKRRKFATSIKRSALGSIRGYYDDASQQNDAAESAPMQPSMPNQQIFLVNITKDRQIYPKTFKDSFFRADHEKEKAIQRLISPL